VSLAPLNCERIRRQVALEVDQEPSRFERAARKAHLVGCPDCRAFAADVRAFTQMLREAPLVPLERPVVVRRTRPAWRSLGIASPAAAAALALAFVGLSGEFSRDGRSLGSQAVSPRVYPTAGELEQEISAVEVAARRSLTFTTFLR
jgi:predicted anti-sigma-YlaC factor YlaD